MIVPQDVRTKHRNIEPYLTNVGDRTKDMVLNYCGKHGFAFVWRYKELSSLAEKIETGRFDRWSNLNDLFACTIVVPTLGYEEATLEFLQSRFDPVDIKVRGSGQKDPNVFHFDSTRFTGRLRPVAGVIDDELTDILFEVQIRSAFEHAWSVTTHALTYKGAEIDWRRMRLAAQLKASVEQLDNLIMGFEESARVISEQSWPEIEAKKRIEGFFREQFDRGLIPLEGRPTNWTRFCDNVFSLLNSSRTVDRETPSELVESAIDALRREIDVLGLAKFPRSVSLLQFVLGALTKEEVLSAPLHQYVPVVTDELHELYPEVKQFEKTFDFELTDAHEPR